MWRRVSNTVIVIRETSLNASLARKTHADANRTEPMKPTFPNGCLMAIHVVSCWHAAGICLWSLKRNGRKAKRYGGKSSLSYTRISKRLTRLYIPYGGIFNCKTHTKESARKSLKKWYNKVTDFDNDAFNTASATIYEREDEILNFFVNRATNASAESLNSKIKAFRAQLRGVVDVPFFLYRLSTIYA